MHTHIHTHMRACTHACMHSCLHARMDMCVARVCAHACMHTRVRRCVHACACVRAHMCACARACMHACVRVCFRIVCFVCASACIAAWACSLCCKFAVRVLRDSTHTDTFCSHQQHTTRMHDTARLLCHACVWCVVGAHKTCQCASCLAEHAHHKHCKTVCAPICLVLVVWLIACLFASLLS